MKCLMKYQWVKLPREHLPPGKGIMGRWAKLAAHAAFRKGKASYCGYSNDVSPGMWAGGVVGLKSILGLRKRTETMQTLQELSDLGYLNFLLELKTKKLTYQITDWVVKCSGKECMNGSVYAVDNYGFLCLPRNITERLVHHLMCASVLALLFSITLGRKKKLVTPTKQNMTAVVMNSMLKLTPKAMA